MKILPIERFISAKPDAADDLLIVANSFEKRCLAFLRSLQAQQDSFKAEKVVIFLYSDRGNRHVRQRARENYKALAILARAASRQAQFETFDFEPYDIVSPVRTFRLLFNSVPMDASIVVDISTIPKIHLLFFLDEALRSQKVARLRLVYARGRYGKYDALSWGAEDPLIVPSFGRPRLSGPGKTSLVLFCGLEPERSYSIWRRFGQDRCFRVFIDSGEYDVDRPTSRAIRLHSFDKREEPIILPAFNPDKVVATLSALYRTCQETNDHMFVAPLTTKWEACAVWQFFRSHERKLDASIVYSAPGTYNAAGYTVDEWGDLLFSDIRLDNARQSRRNREIVG